MNKGPIRDQTFFFVGYEGIGVASRKRVWLYSPVGTIQKWPHSSSIMAYVQGAMPGRRKTLRVCRAFRRIRWGYSGKPN